MTNNDNFLRFLFVRNIVRSLATHGHCVQRLRTIYLIRCLFLLNSGRDWNTTIITMKTLIRTIDKTIVWRQIYIQTAELSCKHSASASMCNCTQNIQETHAISPKKVFLFFQDFKQLSEDPNDRTEIKARNDILRINCNWNHRNKKPQPITKDT